MTTEGNCGGGERRASDGASDGRARVAQRAGRVASEIRCRRVQWRHAGTTAEREMGEPGGRRVEGSESDGVLKLSYGSRERTCNVLSK